MLRSAVTGPHTYKTVIAVDKELAGAAVTTKKNAFPSLSAHVAIWLTARSFG